MSATALDLTFAALGDQTRRDLVVRLARGPATAGELAEPFATSRPAISRHLRVLREAGLVVSRAEGRRQWYSLNGDALEQADEWIEDVHDMWADALASLKEFVEEATDAHGE